MRYDASTKRRSKHVDWVKMLTYAVGLPPIERLSPRSMPAWMPGTTGTAMSSGCGAHHAPRTPHPTQDAARRPSWKQPPLPRDRTRGVALTTMAADEELRAAHQKLQADFSALCRTKGAKEIDTVASQLSQLKLMLAERELLYPQPPSPGGFDVDSLVIARDVAEIGALASVHAKDTDSFDRYWSQLKPFYLDLSYVAPLTQYIPPAVGQLRADRRPVAVAQAVVELDFGIPHGARDAPCQARARQPLHPASRAAGAMAHGGLLLQRLARAAKCPA